jgi:hypothetical protein
MSGCVVVSLCLIAMSFRGVLVSLAVAVAGHHRGLFVCGSRPTVRTPGIQVPFRRRLMGTARALERLLGAAPGALDAVHVRGQPAREFVATPPQFVRSGASSFGARLGVRIFAAAIFPRGSHRFLHDV